ncbi:hypothetical protein JHK87_051481 [Glycine soja]|nr:hypothetical protein JHK87_051481 [Glycine soja]
MLQNIELLCQLRHPNIASLIGFCNHKKKNKIVVQEYISNGSLSQHLPGTIGYIARESHRYGIVADKTDVFSFGVVLLDVVWGRNYLYDIAGLHEASEEILEKCVIIANEIAEKPIEENGDPNIKGKIAPECWRVFIDIAKKCLKIEPPWEK